MKLSKNSSEVASPQRWQLLDNCPVCRLIKRAIIKGRNLTKKEWDDAIAEAEGRINTV